MDYTTIIIALIAAGGAAIPGVLAYRRDKGKSEAETEHIREAVETALWTRVKAENAALIERISVLEIEVVKQRRQLNVARDGLRITLAQLRRLGVTPDWIAPPDWENDL